MLENILKKYVDKNNLSIKEIADRLSLRYGTVRAYIVGEREPPLDFLRNFGKEYGISAHYILYGEVEDAEYLANHLIVNDAIIMVRYYNHVLASAGYGVNNDDEQYELIPIPLSYIKKTYGYDSSKKLYALHVDGDSMLPRINNGAIIIVEETSTISYNDAIYIVRWGEQLYIKYVRNLGLDGIALVSANPLYDRIKLTSQDDITILGRVLFSIDNLSKPAINPL